MEININKARDIFMSRYLKDCSTNNVVHVLYGVASYWRGLGEAFNGYAKKLNDVGYVEGDLYVIVRDCLVTLMGEEINSDVEYYKTVRVLQEILDLVERKNKDYGSSVFNAPCCISSLPVESAILVRLSDKIRRFNNIVERGNIVEETIEDTVKDIVGYLFLYWCVKENKNGNYK